MKYVLHYMSRMKGCKKMDGFYPLTARSAGKSGSKGRSRGADSGACAQGACRVRQANERRGLGEQPNGIEGCDDRKAGSASLASPSYRYSSPHPKAHMLGMRKTPRGTGRCCPPWGRRDAVTLELLSENFAGRWKAGNRSYRSRRHRQRPGGHQAHFRGPAPPPAYGKKKSWRA